VSNGRAFTYAAGAFGALLPTEYYTRAIAQAGGVDKCNRAIWTWYSRVHEFIYSGAACRHQPARLQASPRYYKEVEPEAFRKRCRNSAPRSRSFLRFTRGQQTCFPAGLISSTNATAFQFQLNAFVRLSNARPEKKRPAMNAASDMNPSVTATQLQILPRCHRSSDLSVFLRYGGSQSFSVSP